MKLFTKLPSAHSSIGILVLGVLPQACQSLPQPAHLTSREISNTGTVQLTLPCGPILAIQNNGTYHARGIPYASAQRFEKPSPVSSWTSVKDCTQTAPICPQNPSRFDNITGPLTAGRQQSEDCLSVSVAAPADAKNLPTIVFFHGGAYVTGSGDLDAYSPVPMARSGAVVVTVTSRLGLLGYLPIPNVAPANLGLFDQIEALRWVQKNIHAFGGNPDSVTVDGQSAGGDSVYCMLAANDSKGLFHRAILESAPFGRLNETSRDEMTAAMSSYAAANLSSSSAPASLEQLLALQTAVQRVAAPIDDTILPYGPIFGEDPLPALPHAYEAVNAAAQHIPVFIGYNENDGYAFSVLIPTHNASSYQTAVFADGANQLRQNISETTGRTPPMYHFAWSPPPADSPWGAVHTIELPFLYGVWSAWADAPMLNGSDSMEIVERVGAQMKDLWIAFAKSGDFQGRLFVVDAGFELDQGSG